MTKLPTVLILAAGRGERFRASGGQTHKLEAQIGGRSVLEHVLAAVARSGLPHHVVRPQGHATAGMGDSIASGVKATPDAAGWLVLPADLPLVQPHTLQALARADSHAVTVPTFQGQRGHPVRFAAELREELTGLAGDQGAQSIVRAQQACGGVQLLSVDDEGTVLDVDTLAALEHARALWHERQQPGLKSG